MEQIFYATYDMQVHLSNGTFLWDMLELGHLVHLQGMLTIRSCGTNCENL